MTKPNRTRSVWMSLTILAIIVLGVSNLLARPATRIDPLYVDAVTAIDETMQMVVSNDSYFQANSLCASCHMEIYADWSESMHAKAWRDPVFQAMYTDYQRYLMGDEYYIENDEVLELETEEDLHGRELRRRRWEIAHSASEDIANLEVPVFRIEDIEGEISVQTHGDGLMADGIYNGKININCMRCHAPGADFMMDESLFLENNIDGVFCDYCHTIV
ncbi:hypothetical protein KAU08_10110, partial [bacterium]|nr:hypothetical protein [bacterium]